jgi:excisionase family DNA binding protein
MNTLITTNQAANMLCLSEMTLRKWRWEGKGPRFIKLGRKVAYRQEDLYDWIESQSRMSTSDTG